jgi:uncharacterized protein
MSRAGTIDGLQFARDRDVVTGTLALIDLPRLAELGCQTAAVTYSVRGGENAEGHPSLVVEATGKLALRCQRCLEPLEVALDVASDLELATSEREIATADDGVDRVLATRSMGVAALVEDEVILALPMVPMHDRCEAGPTGDDGARSSPFAALAALRKDGGGKG